MIAAALLCGLLWFGLIAMPAESRWALSAAQLGLFAFACVMILKRGLAIRLHPVAVVLGIAALWSGAQVVLGISADPQRSIEAAVSWTANCAAFSLALVIARDARTRDRFLTAQTVFALGLSIVAVIGLLTRGMLGPFVYKNQFAAFLESIIAFPIAAAIRNPRRSLIWLPVAGAMLAAVVASGSRAGSILCVCELVLLPLIAYARGLLTGRSLVQVSSIALAAGAVLVAVMGWETTWKRLQEPNPYAIRSDLLRSSLAMIQDRPLTGFGMGAWPSAYPAYARYDDGSFVNQAHNDWAQWAVEGGMPFLALMLAVVALLVRPAVRSLWGLGLMAVFVHAWADYPFEQRPALGAFLFAMAGVVAATSSPAADRPDESSRASHPS